jgi:hypothetical protein
MIGFIRMVRAAMRLPIRVARTHGPGPDILRAGCHQDLVGSWHRFLLYNPAKGSCTPTLRAAVLTWWMRVAASITTHCWARKSAASFHGILLGSLWSCGISGWLRWAVEKFSRYRRSTVRITLPKGQHCWGRIMTVEWNFRSLAYRSSILLTGQHSSGIQKVTDGWQGD